MSSNELGNQMLSNPSAGEQRQRMQFARQCFHSVESFLDARDRRSTGHPAVVEAVRDVDSALDDYFEHAPVLPVLVQRDGLYDFQSEQLLWDTSAALAVAETLRAHGIGLLGLGPGVTLTELHRFLGLIARCADDALPFDPALDQEFDHVRLDWLDPSAVQLAGVGADLPPSDPTSVTRATHRLFEREFAERFEGTDRDDDSLLAFLDRPLARTPPSDTSEAPPLPDEAGRPETGDDREPIQVRRAATLRSLLEDRPGESTRTQIAETAAAGLVQLMDNNRFDDARRCLQILRNGDTDIAARLREQVESKLDPHRYRRLAELLAIADPDTRKPLLQFAHLLHSTALTRLFASTIKWDLPESAVDDLIRYLERRSEQEFRQLVDILDKLTTERARRLIDAAADGLPETRSFLQAILDVEIAPTLKSRVLELMQGRWQDRDRVLDAVSPLIGTPDASLRGQAIATIAEIAPEAIEEVLQPYIGESLARRSEQDLDNIVRAYAEYGGSRALRELEDLIRVKRFANEQRRNLAVQLVEVLADLDSDELREMFGRIADDWLVASSVRKACKSARTPEPS